MGVNRNMKKVIVRGPALSSSGYGEHARYVLRALKSRPDLFDIYLVNVSWGQTSWLWRDTDEREWIDTLIAKTLRHNESGGQYDISMQVTIPQEWEKLAPYNIGVTAGTESTKISPQWLEKSLQMDKIIVYLNIPSLLLKILYIQPPISKPVKISWHGLSVRLM
jgi:hypothetical protein